MKTSEGFLTSQTLTQQTTRTVLLKSTQENIGE